jgi:hypothetical protein
MHFKSTSTATSNEESKALELNLWTVFSNGRTEDFHFPVGCSKVLERKTLLESFGDLEMHVELCS